MTPFDVPKSKPVRGRLLAGTSGSPDRMEGRSHRPFGAFRLLTCAGLILVLAASTAGGTEFNVRVESGGASAVTVPPGLAVRYEVLGELSDYSSAGLSSVDFGLSLGGGRFTVGGVPLLHVTQHFTASRRGESDAPNMIRAFHGLGFLPVGLITAGVGQPGSPVVLARDTLVAPFEPGVYYLRVGSLSANVIKGGEPVGGCSRWRIEGAEGGRLTNLTITVSPEAVALVGSLPPDGAIDARQPCTPDGTEVFGWDIVELVVVGDATDLTPSDFVVTHTGDGPAPTVVSVTPQGQSVVLELSDMIEVLAWTTIIHRGSGTSVRLGYLPGDVDGSCRANANDIVALIDQVEGSALHADHQTDIDRSGQTDEDDVSRLFDLLNGLASYPAYQGEELPR